MQITDCFFAVDQPHNLCHKKGTEQIYVTVTRAMSSQIYVTVTHAMSSWASSCVQHWEMMNGACAWSKARLGVGTRWEGVTPPTMGIQENFWKFYMPNRAFWGIFVQ